MDSTELQEKIDECKDFLETLRPRLEDAEAKESAAKHELDEYAELGRRLESMVSVSAETSEPLVVELCDLGHKKVFCKATAQDTSHIFVHVGMGFHAELSLQEAIAFTRKRTQFLRDHVLRHKSIQKDKVRQHICATEMILDGLSAELQMCNSRGK